MLKKTIISCIAILMSLQYSTGQDVSFTAKVSTDTVALGQSFELVYELKNAQGEFEAPELSDFEIYSGPNFTSSYSMINGVSTMSMSYTYHLKPKKVGAFSIDPAVVAVGGETYSTDPVNIVVVLDPSVPPGDVEPGTPSQTKRKRGIRI